MADRATYTRSAYLKAMGIDVWTRRALVAPRPAAASIADGAPAERPVETVDPASPARAAIAAVAAATAGAVDEKKTSAVPEAPAPGSARRQSGPVPRFRLGMLHYGDFSVCVLLNPDQAFPRRLSDDIARLMGSDLSAARYQQLDWPMLETDGVDQSIEAAREVVTHKFSVLADRVLVIGTEASEYYQPLASLEAGTPGRAGRQSLLRYDALSDVTGTAAAKKQFLLSLMGWRDS